MEKVLGKEARTVLLRASEEEVIHTHTKKKVVMRCGVVVGRCVVIWIEKFGVTVRLEMCHVREGVKLGQGESVVMRGANSTQ